MGNSKFQTLTIIIHKKHKYRRKILSTMKIQYKIEKLNENDQKDSKFTKRNIDTDIDTIIVCRGGGRTGDNRN